MAPTPGLSTTASGSTSVANPTVNVPSDAVVGDQLLAILTTSGIGAITAPAGWNQQSTGVMLAGGSTGSYSVVTRTMASGVTQAQWSLANEASGFPATKYDAGMTTIKSATTTIVPGTVATRPSGGFTTDVPGVTVPAGGLLVVTGGDKVSSQTLVTPPSGMTAQVNHINGGGGGVSVLIATQAGVSGASGTKTITYAVQSGTAFGQAFAYAAATGTPPVVSAGADVTTPLGGAKTLAGSSTGTTNLWTAVSFPGSTAPTITNATSATNATVTPTKPGIYTFRLTGTNADGSVPDEMVMTVTGTTVYPTAVINSGGFTSVGGAPSPEEALGDGSDTTYLEGPTTAGSTFTVLLGPIQAGSGYTAKVRFRTSVAPTATVTYDILQGGTVILTRSQPSTTGQTTFTFAFTAAEVSALTNGSDLRARVTVQ